MDPTTVFCPKLACRARVPKRPGQPQPPLAHGAALPVWTVQELLSFHVPPPRWTPPTQRGRRSHALKCLIERWCGNHG
jgi:hypothetical protein